METAETKWLGLLVMFSATMSLLASTNFECNAAPTSRRSERCPVSASLIQASIMGSTAARVSMGRLLSTRAGSLIPTAVPTIGVWAGGRSGAAPARGWLKAEQPCHADRRAHGGFCRPTEAAARSLQI